MADTRYGPDGSVNSRKGSVGFVVDFGAETVLEDDQNGGASVNKPAGTVTSPGRAKQTAGGRGSIDTEAARRLGSSGGK
jgi:hypothetical protein